MEQELKRTVVDRLKEVGAYDARVADPTVGFEHSLPDMHPLQVWPECRSIIVYAVATPPEGNNTYLGPRSHCDGDRRLGPVPDDLQSEEFAVDRLCRMLLSSITLRGIAVLMEAGHDVRFWPSMGFQLKLSAYEAGIGVYGKQGIIIHPELGSRIRLGAIATSAMLPPDGRLIGFDPCASCEECLKACPAQAFDRSVSYPASYTREKCTVTRARIAKRGLYCHNCYAACPAGKIPDDELLTIRHAESYYDKQ
jgi:epoxyqueuosine reductase QueG